MSRRKRAAGLEPDLAVRHPGIEQRHERRLIARPALAVRGLAAVAVVRAVLADVAAVERRVRRGIHPRSGRQIGQRAEVTPHAELCRRSSHRSACRDRHPRMRGRIVEADRAEPVARRQRDLLFHRACHGQRAVDAVRAAVDRLNVLLPRPRRAGPVPASRAVAVRQRELRGPSAVSVKVTGVLCAVQEWPRIPPRRCAQCGKKRRSGPRLVRRPQAGQRRA